MLLAQNLKNFQTLLVAKQPTNPSLLIFHNMLHSLTRRYPPIPNTERQKETEAKILIYA